ncbi:hypothetical protein A8V01_09820 [Novosphingobium guangzhouense]|uniref:Iron transporter n=1 Tax=Novosphingobium guangzhouense TaxID=1850347 RepID=A0A2K2FTS8_9SPHN|nr:hypothetical protein A8V01_09820 [Novosphingobium guangzhouense]
MLPAAAVSARRHRRSVTARTLAGTLGAYGVTAQATIVLSFMLALCGMDRAEAVVAATLASFAIFALVSMAVFHTGSASRAWIWLVTASVPLAFLQWVLSPL